MTAFILVDSSTRLISPTSGGAFGVLVEGPTGAAIAVDDTATVEAGSDPVIIDVLANDLGDELELLSGPQILSGGGSVTTIGLPPDRQLQFTPPSTADTTVIEYRVLAEVGGIDRGLLTVITTASSGSNPNYEFSDAFSTDFDTEATSTEGEPVNDFGDPPTSTSEDDILLYRMIGF